MVRTARNGEFNKWDRRTKAKKEINNMTKSATKTKKTIDPVTTTVDAPTVNAVLENFNNNGRSANEPIGQLIRTEQLFPSPS